MVTQLPDRLEEWSELLESAVLEAGKKWSEATLEDVFPKGLTAATDPEQMSLDAILATANTWAATASTEMAPAMIAFMVAQTWDVTTARKVDLRPLSGAASTPAEHKAAFSKAVDILHSWGYKDEQIEVVVTTRSWWDEMARQLAVTPNKVVGMPETIYRDLVVKLGAATNEGLDMFERNLIVREFLDMSTEGGFEKWNTRAARIARTETHRLINAGTMQAARDEQAISGEALRKSWVCTWDSRTRDDHFRADGQVVPIDGKFMIGGYEADYPGDPNLPAHLSINCVVGDTHLEWTGQGVSSATKRKHTGTFVNLITANGNNLTVTPNHPVLTSRGYVAAGDLSKGERVMCSPVTNSPEVNQMPPRADEFHRALSQAGMSERIVGSSVDFHGDGAKGNEVHIVRPHGDLFMQVDSRELAGSSLNDEFVRIGNTESVLSSGGGFGSSGQAVSPFEGVGVGSLASGSVGSSGDFPPLVFAHGGHADGVSLGGSARFQPQFFKPSEDSGAADVEFLRHLENARALGMEFAELIQVNEYFGTHDVYNLSTTDEWYIANGITVHNCRCTHVILGEGEELPDNSDRQTERERRSEAEAGTTRQPSGEVTSRAARGVTRDADNQPLTASTTPEQETKMNRQKWSGVLAPVGKPSGDGRILMEDAQLSFRDFPLPLMFQKSQSEGHNTGVIVGKIEGGTVEGGAVHASGVLFDTPEAGEAAELLAEEVVRPSVDLCDMVANWVMFDAEGDPVQDIEDVEDWEGLTEQMQVTEATIMGATLVAKPAFAEAKITLGDEAEGNSQDDLDNLVAAAAVATRHDSAMFTNPQLAGPTPLTVDGEHVFGHLALWDTEHMSFPGRGVNPPHSATNYALFHTSQLETEAGAVSVGRLTVGTGHAGARDDVHAASEHYDTTGTTWAFVKAGEDKHGIWVAGVVNPDAEASQVRAGASAPLSGDWRKVGNNLELVAALSVNTPGFPVPRAFQNTATESMSLVAAGVAPRLSKHDEMVAAVLDAIKADREQQELAEAKQQREKAARSMAAQLLASNLQGGL